MGQRKTNYFARVAAVFALLGALVLVVATIATSGGDGDGNGGDETELSAEGSGPTKKGQSALNEGVWIVEDGDTLVSIAEETGIDIDELVELNADIDPQALIAGQRISLRVGQASTDDESSSSDSGGDPADDFGDGSVDGEDSGDGTSTSP